jgi:hypothetical protein
MIEHWIRWFVPLGNRMFVGYPRWFKVISQHRRVLDMSSTERCQLWVVIWWSIWWMIQQTIDAYSGQVMAMQGQGWKSPRLIADLLYVRSPWPCTWFSVWFSSPGSSEREWWGWRLYCLMFLSLSRGQTLASMNILHSYAIRVCSLNILWSHSGPLHNPSRASIVSDYQSKVVKRLLTISM